jgi:cephalosporin hydroxylase
MATPLSYASKVQQHLGELEQFLKYVREHKFRSYCEIGCKFGGLVWQVAQALEPRSKIVCVDMPNQAWGRSDSEESLRNCADALRKLGHDVHLFVGDSTRPDIVESVKALAPFDLMFIDANHTEKYVRADFGNYGTLTNVLCFHDIGWRQVTPPGRLPNEVPKVWANIKELYRFGATFREIMLDNGHNGIGIMEWH